MSIIEQLTKHIVFPIDNENQAQRLFHGRGHVYEGLQNVTVDWLPPVVLITLFSPENFQSINTLTSQLLQFIPQCKSVQLQHRYKLHGPIDVIYGKRIDKLEIEENKLIFQVQLGKSRNTGIFLDMKNGRNWVHDNCADKRVLNLFSYTCAFSVAAVAGGAKSVLNIDMSSAALNVGRINHRLNNHDLNNVKFEKLNIFKSFGRLKKRGPFDLLICDPPTLQKGSVDIKRDYPKIMRRLDQFMTSNSILMLCLNAPELGKEFLIDNMQEHAPNYRFIKEIGTPEIYADAQNKGLKVMLFSS